MRKISLIVLILFICVVNDAFAQLKKANRYYDSYDYPKAIRLYTKAVKKNENAEALEKLANSYRLTKKYPQAELYYARLVKLPNIDPINHFYYGMVLKNNGKIDEAKEQFRAYVNSAPNDKVAELSVRSCDEIKVWINKTKQFEVTPVPNINSVHSDFSPVYYKNEMVFPSAPRTW